MTIKGLIFEDLVNYKVPCLTIEMPYCTFKCDKECGKPVCQNGALAKQKPLTVEDNKIFFAFRSSPLHKAICFQGLEPLDSFDELWDFIFTFRNVLEYPNDIVIYTGYKEEEIEDKIKMLQKFENIIVKFGRFIPDQESIYDEVLGVNLSSPNQYARRIS